MKKVLSIIGIIVGSLVLLSVVAPMIMGVILKVQVVANSVGIIGGADGPTAIMIVGVGNIIIEIVIGVLLIVAGICGLKKFKK